MALSASAEPVCLMGLLIAHMLFTLVPLFFGFKSCKVVLRCSLSACITGIVASGWDFLRVDG